MGTIVAIGAFARYAPAWLPAPRIAGDPGGRADGRADGFAGGADPRVVDAPAVDDVKGARILVVDDDADMRGTLCDYLDRHDLVPLPAANKAEMGAVIARGGCDLVVLDMRLGADDGLDLLRDLRAKGTIPVIVLTGHRRDEVDRVVGLEMGADDYMTKPASLRELLARIRTVLRRSEGDVDRPPPLRKSRFDGWVVDRRLRILADPDGMEVKLTKGEYALLIAFLDAPGRALSREDLLNATRVHEDVFDRSIDVQILRLRRKLERDPSKPSLIVTERGFGYRFSAKVENSR